MKLPLPFTAGLIASLFSLLSGCATTGARIQARIDEKPEVFAALTKQQQKDIKWGYIRPGFTPDMVYLACGSPVKVIESDEPGAFIWIYVDRATINQEVAMAAAMQAGETAGSIPGFSSANANFPSHGFVPPSNSGMSTEQAYTESGATTETNEAAVWVVFREGKVVNTRRIGASKPIDNGGSLGG